MAKRIVSKTEFARMCGVTPASITKALGRRLADAADESGIHLDHPAAQAYYNEKQEPQDEEPVPGVDPLFEDALAHCRKADRWTASAISRGLGTGYRRAVRIHAQLQAAGHIPEPQQEAAPAGPSGQAAAPQPKAKPRQHGKGRKSSWNDDSELVEVPEDIEELADLTLRELIAKFGTGYRFLDWLKSLKEIEAINEKRIKNAESEGRLISRRLVEVGVIDPFNSAHMRLMTDGAKAITQAVLSKHQAGISDQEIEAYVTDVVGSFIRPVKAKVERNLAQVDPED